MYITQRHSRGGGNLNLNHIWVPIFMGMTASLQQGMKYINSGFTHDPHTQPLDRVCNPIRNVHAVVFPGETIMNDVGGVTNPAQQRALPRTFDP